MAILHATDMMSEDIVMSPLHWFNYDYLHDNRAWDYRRTNVIWRYFYTAISSANNVLGMTSAESTSKDVLALRGQALALRAFSYFYLVQLYQHVYPVVNGGADLPGVPLYYAGNEEQESITARASVKTILAQIEDDLTTAIGNLDGWSRGTTKNKIDYNVANGLLARYYLLTEQWDNAIDAAQKARTGYPIMSDIYDGFMNIGNTEWLWGFDHNAETTTLWASFFSHISNLTGGYAGSGLAPRLIDRRLYENIPETDARKKWFQSASSATTFTPQAGISEEAIAWKAPYANLKFGYDGAFTMDYIYMRASEMVLIEAEALANLGKGSEAATLLKAELLSKRDPSWNQASVTVDDVHLQRRIELWGEGFATFDLKRLNKGIDRTYSGTNHYPSAQFKINAGDKRWIYRIPQSEIQENPDISETDNNE
jgi:hypothetical protein